MGLDDVYQPGSVLDIPTRPPWDYSMSKDEVIVCYTDCM